MRVGIISAKTGDAARSGLRIADAARFAAAEINAHGGFLGHHVVLIEFDNKSTPEGSINAARQAVKADVLAVVGAAWSSNSLAAAKILQPAGIPMISPLSTNPDVTRVGDCIFRISFTDDFQGKGLAQFALTNLQAATAVVLVNEKRPYSEHLAETFISTFESGHGRLLWRGNYGSDVVLHDDIIRAVAGLKPDVVFIPDSFKHVGGFLVAAKQQGVNSKFLSGDGIGLKLYDEIGFDAEGVYYSNHWSRWVNTPESKEFVRKFESVYGPIKTNAPALTYDCMTVLADAVRRSGSLNRKKVRDALSETNGVKGITGTISFNSLGDPVKSMTINQLRFGGLLFVEQITP
ncbi:ABC transporter substrate-binding protein [uncultured Pseudodesulfovibrio sp.]|uniref:ABC transporter substrate-binding protein n=1 Tax=uncultured Pseudodesulfovibrio sp. TaxID=2035858 RepID=UPI0029C6A37A|nr:ABC transporter substrate-binding protein [uncultured Pseudodesulfovibrio sp.]